MTVQQTCSFLSRKWISETLLCNNYYVDIVCDVRYPTKHCHRLINKYPLIMTETFNRPSILRWPHYIIAKYQLMCKLTGIREPVAPRSPNRYFRAKKSDFCYS
jgi:hypothetical protein